MNPNPVNNTRRIGAEMLATADSLRLVRTQLSHLVNADHPAVVGQHETTVILIDGLRVANALETLGQRIGIVQ